MKRAEEGAALRGRGLEHARTQGRLAQQRLDERTRRVGHLRVQTLGTGREVRGGVWRGVGQDEIWRLTAYYSTTEWPPVPIWR